jgi:predicted PurR-regulated permease PerM
MQIPPATIRFGPTLKWVAVVLVCVGVYVLYAAVHDVALVFFGAVVVAYIFYPVISWITPYTVDRVYWLPQSFTLWWRLCWW